MENIKAVIFDMDGVITETSEMHYEAWLKLASELGIYFDKTFNEELKGISRKESLLKILSRASEEHSYNEFELEGLMTKKNNHYLELISGYSRDHLNPGILRFMRELKENGIKVAVASASKSAPLLIKMMEIEDIVDYIVNPASVPGKPEPDIFLKAAEYFGFLPKECIGVEDAQAGVESIKRAGMFAVGIGDQKVLRNADVVFSSTDLLTLQSIGEVLNG